MPQVSVLGIDLAKQLFHVVGMDDTSTMIWRKRLTRSGLMPYIAQLPPMVIGMEACGGTHDWVRRFREHGSLAPLVCNVTRRRYLRVYNPLDRRISLFSRAFCFSRHGETEFRILCFPIG
jgi:transposase